MIEGIIDLYIYNMVQILGLTAAYSIVNGTANMFIYKFKEKKIAKTLDNLETFKTISEPSQYEIDKLDKYIKIMNDKFNTEDLNTMYKNIQNVALIRTNKAFSIIGGKYDFRKNQITINNPKSLPHEFAHLCSSDSKKIIYENGFEVICNSNRFGYGLNEGYTEVFAHRNFKSEPSRAYKNSANIASLIEKLFTYPREMEELYLNHDLKGLINKMSTYMEIEDAIYIINKLDMAHTFKMNGNILASTTYAEIESFLVPYIKNKDYEDNISNITKLYLKIKK